MAREPDPPVSCRAELREARRDRGAGAPETGRAAREIVRVVRLEAHRGKSIGTRRP